MRSVLQHLGLDDRDDAGLLAERGVAGECVRVRPDAVLARLCVADGVRRAPLGKAGSEVAVLLEPLAQAVEAFGHGLALGVRERLRALVHLDARDDALRGEQLRERSPVVGLLADRLVEEDDPADVLLGAWRREEKVAVGAPILLGGLDADGVEALLDGAAALVGREDPFSLGDECARGLVQLGVRHGISLSRFWVSGVPLWPGYNRRSRRT